MHLFRCAEDCIDRAGLDTQGAANAGQLINKGYGFWLFLAILRIERHGLNPKQIRQCPDAGFPTRRTLIDSSFPIGQGFSIGPAARVVALAALGLRQEGFDPVKHRIRLDLKAARSPTESEAG